MGDVLRDVRSRKASRRKQVAPASSPAADWSSRGDDEAAVARYIADMTGQLEAMAVSAHLDLLAYFLSMARAESEISARLAAAPSTLPSSNGPIIV